MREVGFGRYGAETFKFLLCASCAIPFDYSGRLRGKKYFGRICGVGS